MPDRTYAVAGLGVYAERFGYAYHGRGVARDGYVPFEYVTAAAPFARDGAVDRIVRCLDMVEALGEDGRHVDFLEAVAAVGTLDSRQILVVPYNQVAQQHDVVAGVHGRIGRVAVPQLPYRRGAVGDHVSPARVVLVRCYAQGQIPAPALRQPAHEVLYAQHSRTHMAAELDFGLVYDVVEYLLFVSFGHQPQPQREQVARDRIVAVAGSLAVEELFVVCLFDTGCELQVAIDILRLAADAGETRHLLQYVVEDGGAEDRTRGLSRRVLRMDQGLRLGGHAPVAVGVVDDDAVAQRMLACEVDPLLHGIVVAPYGAVVAVVTVEHVGTVEEGRRPSHFVVVDGPITRRYGRDGTFGAARILYVLKPLVVEQRVVEDVCLTAGARCAVAEPSHSLVSLRAVGGHAAVVAANAPEGVAVNAVEQRYRTLEPSRGAHAVVEYISCHVFSLGGIVKAVDLDIAEPVVRETRMPLEYAVAGGRIYIRGACRAQVGRIERRIGIDGFGETHRHGLSGAAVEPYAEPSHHVLPHVDDDLAVGTGRDAEGRYLVLYGYVGVGLRMQGTFGRFHEVGPLPRRIVVLRGAPSREFEAGVVLLAVEFVVCHDGAERGDTP